ncbi:MAG: signal peptide peptidase SppA [Gemmatimonadaceae bacterium]|nr:signal peptide peptidase SppA [Acetobacteraceae bacterium]
MSLETDLILDRRRIKRRLNLWRVLAVGAAVVALIAVVAPQVGGGVVGRRVARLNVTGVITEDRKLVEAVVALAKDRSVPAVIVSIDSPGGSVAGGESLRGALMRVAAVKPVVAVMRGTAASAGYMVALPAARIFARDATLTGSIGVILQTGEVSGLLGRLGVSAEAITSGALKDQPSVTRGLTPQGRDYLNGLVGDMYDQFVTMVADGRKMDPAQVRTLADGRAYTGRQAQKLGLVDEIGGEIEAREWLERERGVPISVPAIDVRPGGLLDRTMSNALSGFWQWSLGLAPAGAWAIWQGGEPG